MSVSQDKKQQGITLIEVLITITILMVGILTLARLFPLALKISRSAEQTTIATNLAQAKIEEMFYLDYDNIQIGEIEKKQRLASESENPFYYYQRETNSEYVDGNLDTSASDTGMKKITTIVYFKSPILLTEKNVELSIIIGKK